MVLTQRQVVIRKVTGEMGRSLTTEPRWYVDYLYRNKRIHGPFWSRADAEANRDHYFSRPSGGVFGGLNGEDVCPHCHKDYTSDADATNAPYTIKVADVGRHTIRAFGRHWLVQNFMGRVLPGDVGKRIFLHADGTTVHVEK